MVYESDFYTTRRPYSRPLASSYSVTNVPVVLPLSSIIQLRAAPRMPYVAHKRLVSVIHVPVHNVYYTGSMIPIRIHSRVRPSVIAAELKRIRDLPRPSTESYTCNFLNSKDQIYFDDEAKEIRARVDSLLRRVHVFVPRASPSDFAEEIVPERMRSGDYVRRLISGRNNAKKDDVEAVSWYDVPERGNFGNLACVKYVAGKPQSVRRPYYKVADLRPSDIKNDVNFLSYYQKNRQAAANASPDHPMTERELRKARALETEWSESIAMRESKKKVEEPVEEEEPKAAKTKPAKESKPKKAKEANKVETPKEAATPVVETTKVVEFVAEPVNLANSTKEKKTVAEPSESPSKRVEILEESPRKIPEKVELAKEPETLPEPAPVEQKAEPVPVEQKTEPAPVEQKTEPAPVEQKTEPAPVEQETEPTVKSAAEPVVEAVAEPVAESVAESVAEPVAETVAEPVTEPPAEPTTQSTTESVVEHASEDSAKPVEEAAASESVQEAMPETTEEAKTMESNELVSEQDQQQEGDSEEVKQEKLDAARRIEEYMRKAEEEARTEEEKRAAAEQERLRLELEEQKVWEALQIDVDRKAHLDEILDQERALAEKKAEEERLEAERAEIERLEAAERLLNTEKLKALMEEQERMLIEERAEELRQRQEMEERLAEVARGEISETKDRNCSRDDRLVTELTDQEMEEKPYEVTTDDETRIEEENMIEDEVEDIPADPFVEEPDGAESKPVPATGGAAIEDVYTSAPEETFEWPKDEDA